MTGRSTPGPQKTRKPAKASQASAGAQDEQANKGALGLSDGQAGQGSQLDQAAKAVQAREDKGSPSTIEGIYVRSFPPVFRRAGFAFTSDGVGIALTAITAEQLKALQDEPLLSVEFCDFLPDDTIVGAAEAGEQNATE